MEQPTQDEIRRVGEYWQWVKDMACEHPEITFNNLDDNRAACGKCGRPIVIMSDVQLEAIREKKTETSG